MRIAIDARAYGWAGVGRYTRNLISNLLEVDKENEYIICLGKQDLGRFQRDMAGFFEEATSSTLPASTLRARCEIKIVDGSYYSWREQTKLAWQLSRVKADLWHFTHFNVPLLFSRPYVVTIHDVTRFIFPGQRQQGVCRQLAYEFVFKRAVERALGVIYVSAATRGDLKLLPVKEGEQTAIIHEGIEDRYKQIISKEDRQGARMLVGGKQLYLLYVGVWMEHKNIGRMLAAFAQVKKRQHDLKLVMTGRPRRGYVDVSKLAHRAGLKTEDIVYLGYVSEELLPALYVEAECLLMVSLYEGFGLPALEAAATGCPVVTSGVSSLPEVMGEAAEYVNPDSVFSIVDGIERILQRVERKEELAGKGKERVARFSWPKCARETLAVYKDAIRNP